MDFQPGETVRLKSGGPVMTVEKVDISAMLGKAVWCCWFERVGSAQELKRETFPIATVEPATVAKSSIRLA